MLMSGVPDPLYVAARTALLDALEAIGRHRGAVVLVGAQAVYVRAGASELAVAAYTTDADLAIDPTSLGPEPLLEEMLGTAGFSRSSLDVGAWSKDVPVEGAPRRIVVDLLVPETLGGPGRRGARIPPHDNLTARKVIGLEGALVDRDPHNIGALDRGDSRAYEVNVAGPAALLVAKVFKIWERRTDSGRLRDKDALDVLRLLQTTPTADMTKRVAVLLANPVSQAITAEGLGRLPELFGSRTAPGSIMAARAARGLEREETIAASIAALTQDLLEAIES
jgi:hypothetical protein